MGLFNKKPKEPEEQEEPLSTPFLNEKRANSGFAFRALACIYLIYLVYSLISDFVKGNASDISLWFLILVCAVFITAAVWFWRTSYAAWKASKAEFAEWQAQQELEKQQAIENGEYDDLDDDLDKSDGDEGK